MMRLGLCNFLKIFDLNFLKICFSIFTAYLLGCMSRVKEVKD